MWLFKICGMVLLLVVCSMAGFLKSYNVKKRAEKLCVIARSLSDLADRLSLSEEEIIPLLKQSFPKGLLIFEQNSFSPDNTHLNSEDISLLEELFSRLGLQDSGSEYRRICGYAKIIKERGDTAREENVGLCRLYKSCGFLSGLFLCIFFL